MSRADFDRFMQRKQEEKVEAAFLDPKQQLAEWLNHLDELYGKINNYLEPYIDAGTAQVEFQAIKINEDFVGPYEATKMILRIGASTVVFEPVGTMLIGSKGRVDVQGPRGGARLSLIDRHVTHGRQLVRVRITLPGDSRPAPEPTPGKPDWAWKIITPAPEMKFIELKEDSFFDMILDVTDA